jgi:diguanylate cyclase
VNAFIMRDDAQLENQIAELLNDPQYAGHPAREALAALFAHYQDQLTQLEKLTTISDGYQQVLRERNQSLAERYRKQIKQLQKIVRISDHYQQMLRELNETLKVASTQDPLTNLANRRLMLDRLNAEAALFERHKQPFSLALADADFFKSINDEHGHETGDTALVAIARALSGALRAYDVCARWGGEEFLMLLPETDGANAQNLANRLRLTVEAIDTSALPSGIHLSISIGVAEHRPGATITETIRRADNALYEAKNSGRNRVVLAN